MLKLYELPESFQRPCEVGTIHRMRKLRQREANKLTELLEVGTGRAWCRVT